MPGGRSAPIPIDDDVGGAILLLSSSALSAAEILLRSFRGEEEEEHEGILWLVGAEWPDKTLVLAVVAPAAFTTPGSFTTHANSNARLVEFLASQRLQLVGQIHSHPGRWVDHSEGDDAGALVRYEGYWSIVVPEYCSRGCSELSHLGIHRYSNRAFRRLTVRACEARVRVILPAFDHR